MTLTLPVIGPYVMGGGRSWVVHRCQMIDPYTMGVHGRFGHQCLLASTELPIFSVPCIPGITIEHDQ